MNSISWFIYTAQVSQSMGITFCVLGIVGLILIGLYMLIATINATIDAEEFRAQIPRARLFALTIALIISGNLLPERNTMYAIAASQVGERIAKNETVQGLADDVTKALQEWIKKQIEANKK